MGSISDKNTIQIHQRGADLCFPDVLYAFSVVFLSVEILNGINSVGKSRYI